MDDDQPEHEQPAPTRRWLESALARELHGRTDLLPPWLKYPELERYSLGWRMGGGETYLILWGEWVKRLSQAALLDYWRNYAPLPIEWLDWVAFSFGRDDLEDRWGEAGVFTGVRWLEGQGLADFAAFKAWFDAQWGLDDEDEPSDMSTFFRESPLADGELDLRRAQDRGRPDPSL